MKIFKFGGASLQNYSRIQLVLDILQTTSHRPLVIVVSAMGKTTNALEKVVEYGCHQQPDLALQMLDDIVARHTEIIHELFPEVNARLLQQLQAFLDPVRNLLTQPQGKSYDALYDQVVSAGEILSSLIISACLHRLQISHDWIDARSIIHTDSRYREAELNWPQTQQAITEKLIPVLQQKGCVLTQGFIGCAPDGSTTTLGREGSDYTAAILGHVLNAESVTIWKDVPGLQNADPKLVPDTRTIPEISYREVIEMAYYGAQVIHPRTIQPLQQKNIPLLVKCFLDKQLPGTRIHERMPDEPLPPIIVWKKNQVWVEFTTRDFSFVTEHRISKLYQVFHQLHIKINLMQNGAISFSCCMDHQPEKLNALIHDLQHDFEIQYREGMELLTIRHPQNGWHQELIRDYLVWVEQKSPNTLQMVVQHASQASIPVVPVH
ncbi:aspartate kinase [Thermoflavifilum aggregans]|uniref:Aspartokinase n=1 Tax=Thermoflavifilum aggregans TaxID=454188 RepID=A0A2M9CVQ4_9BACT|nr:aspartate kinase [Thermoflavifilum aggregans]PJJ75980.1 aspartate kinase [Thermoflavifilum aggregans]